MALVPPLFIAVMDPRLDGMTTAAPSSRRERSRVLVLITSVRARCSTAPSSSSPTAATHASMRSLASRLQTTTGVVPLLRQQERDFEQALMRSTERHIRDTLMTINLSSHSSTGFIRWSSGWSGADALKRTLLLALDAQRQAPDAQVTIAQAAQRLAKCSSNRSARAATSA